MSQGQAWEKEYRKPKLVSLNSEPQQVVKDFRRFIKDVEGKKLLDLGCGNGRNLKYFKDHVPGLLEVSIGHALISDALYFGLENTVQLYLRQLK